VPHRTVREIMTTDGVCVRSPRSPVREALRLMAEHNVSSVLVAEGERLLGIFTERDAIRRVVAAGRDPDATTLAEVMTREPDTIAPEDTVANVIRRMDEFGYEHLPVEDGGRLVGLVSIHDCPQDDIAAMAGELELRRAVAERAW
jgi:CBS domain-containing protein